MLKNDFWDIFAGFHPDCWVQTQHLENEFRYVKFGIDEKNVELVSKKFDFLELKLFLKQFTVQFSSVQFSSVQFSSQFT